MPRTREEMLAIGTNTRFKKGKAQSEIARKGAEARIEKQRKEKQMKEAAQEILLKEMPNGMILQDILLNNLAAKAGKEQATIQELLKTLEFLRDTAGQKPVDKKSYVDNDGQAVNPAIINVIGV